MRGVKGLKLISLMVFLSCLVMGGWGLKPEAVRLIYLIISLAYWFWVKRRSKEFRRPLGLGGYGLFLGWWLISLSWSVNWQVSASWLGLYLAGGLIWWAVVNDRRRWQQMIESLWLWLGLIFAVLFGWSQIKGVTAIKPDSLYLPFAVNQNHYHIGDLWAVVGLVILSRLIKQRRLRDWLILGLGLSLIIWSRSRAAVVSLIAGFGFLLTKHQVGHKKWLKPAALFLAVVLFLSLSRHKTTLFSRPYYIQALAGLKSYPLGVGVGNFRVISADSRHYLWGMSGFSDSTHSWILEMFSGLGWLGGGGFLIWLMQVGRWALSSHRSGLYQVLWLALTVNFCLHFSYEIPALLWLWFISLGLL